ncbi:MAG: penicillin-binding protein 2 [Candidatus Saccharibacteria bacterium]|nr:penicillin-binding protein 2 [Candidatus Saccharibacteria bacterium]
MKYLFAKGSRVRVLSAILVLGTGIIIVRLFQLQVVDHQKYVAMAYREQVKKLTIPAKRGLIYATDGDAIVPLVMNNTVYTMFVDPQLIKKTEDEQAIIQAMSEQRIKTDGVRDKITHKQSRYQVIGQNISRKQAEALKEKKLIGVGFQAVSQRVYPENQLASQLLGFVNTNGGQYGLEGYLNKRLSGTDGMLEAVTDVSAVPLSVGDAYTNIPAKNGDNLVLSIDRNIQSRIEQILKSGIERTGATNGSVLVMNPQNGQVMAMANYPSYNVAEYAKTENIALFNNPIVDQPYEVGSVAKVFTVAMGINEGVISAATQFYNQDCIKVFDRTICNAFRGKTGTITMQEALQYSLNTGMINIISRLGDGSIGRSARDIMYNYLHNKFRLGRVTDVELPEAKGTIIAPTEIEGNAVRYSNMSFGQGMDLTMMQAASAFSAIINGGKYYQPTLIRGTYNDKRFVERAAKLVADDVVKSTTSDQVRQMLIDARKLYYAKIDKAGYQIGGKTGTSEKLVDGKYTDDQTIATYLGFGGATNRPKYVIMVRLDGKEKFLAGNTDAAPIFTEISNWLIDYLKIYPKE